MFDIDKLEFNVINLENAINSSFLIHDILENKIEQEYYDLLVNQTDIYTELCSFNYMSKLITDNFHNISIKLREQIEDYYTK